MDARVTKFDFAQVADSSCFHKDETVRTRDRPSKSIDRSINAMQYETERSVNELNPKFYTLLARIRIVGVGAALPGGSWLGGREQGCPP